MRKFHFPSSLMTSFVQILRGGLDRLLMRGIKQMGVDHGRGHSYAVSERFADIVDRRARNPD